MARRALTVDAAEDKLRAILAAPPYTHSGGGTTFHWERPQWKQLRAVLDELPAGVDAALLDRVLATCGAVLPSSSYRDQSPALAPAILRFLETRTDHADVAFIVVAMQTGRGPLQPRLDELMLYTVHGNWIGRTTREHVLAQIAARPEIVEGARAAAALEQTHVTSRYWPILLADGTADSLDLLLPEIERMCREHASELTWLVAKALPLFGDTKAARAVAAMIREAADEKAAIASPAIAFVAKLGVAAPPKIVTFTVTWRASDGRTVYQVRCDSKRDAWLVARRTPKWQWRGFDGKKLADTDWRATATDYVLRVGKGLDREPIERWALALWRP